MKCLVTGGAGFIGSHVVDLLVEKGHKVVVIDNLSSGVRRNVNFKAAFYQEDLINHERIREIFKEENFEAVFHLAAQMDVRKSVTNPLFDAKENILNTLNLLELSKDFGIKKFVFSSSGGAIYGDTEIPTKEEHEAKPISPYGVAKLTIEKYLHYYHKVHGLNFTALRYANVYGPRQGINGEAGVIGIFFKSMFENKTPRIYGGIQTRDFVYVTDVARANLLALEDKNSEIYNIGTGKEADIIKIFSEINEFFGHKFKAEYKEGKKGEQMKSCLSYEKIKRTLGWEPTVSLSDGLARTYSCFLKDKLNNKNFLVEYS
jgi:UDP-glucose 4-epimerase